MLLHDLRHEFPELETKITEMKVSNNHFRKLFDEYHETNDTIKKIEEGLEVHSDTVLTDFRMKRLRLKDELYSMLTN